MGSMAPSPHPEGRAFMLALQRSMSSDVAEGREIDVSALIAIVDNTFDDLRQRDKVIHYLAAYLARTLSGTLPDITTWLP